jgi:hypothetical protein
VSHEPTDLPGPATTAVPNPPAAKLWPAKFRKLPVVVEAAPFLNNATSYDLLHWVNTGQFERSGPDAAFARWENGALYVPTDEGEMRASPGDWIIRGVKGEFYPCKPDVFARTYEAAP